VTQAQPGTQAEPAQPAQPAPGAGQPEPDDSQRAAGASRPGSATATGWQHAPRSRRLATVAVVAVIAAVVTRHADLLLLAAPALAVLAASRRSLRLPPPSGQVAVSPSRCFEDEEVEVIATLDTPVEEASFHLEPNPAVVLADGLATQVVVGEQAPQARWTLRPHVWGRHLVCTVTVRCRSGGVSQADLTLRPGVVEVFPHPPPARATLLPADLLLRIGEHTAATAGAGIEFFGIRSYQPGDRLRDVNWSVTSRLGRPYINQRAAQRAADLVVMIDAFSEVGPPGDTTLDIAVRGAAGLATAYLRTGDRVGVVVLGGALKWLTPAPGNRQFFRIVEMTFGVRFRSEVTPDLDRIPRMALPPRSLVVLFSPLLDRRTLNAVTDLRQRGVSLVIVDVLRHEPPVEPKMPASALAVRLWRLDRAALRGRLSSLGVPVLTWDAGTGLEGAQALMRGRRVGAGRR
jgi:uncharacterized protein (DUF58 family)